MASQQANQLLMTARPSPKKPYLDSSVFFAHVKKETILADNGLMRWVIAYNILKAAEAKRFKVFTSTLSIAEVRRLKLKNTQLAAHELQTVQELFQHSYIESIETSREVAEKAQALGAQYGIEVMDSVHIATAIVNESDLFFVWDKPLTSILPNAIEGVTICEPYSGGVVQMPPSNVT